MMLTLHKHRPAFSMVTAIGVMLIMGLLASFILSTSASTSQETITQYHKEQAALLAQAYTEAAILAILKRDVTTTQCVQTITGDITTLAQNGTAGGSPAQGRGYKVNVNIAYIANTGTDINTTTCPAANILNKSSTNALLDFNASYASAPIASLSAIIDVYVRYKNPNYPDVAAAPWITYHRRTLQKI